MYIKQWKKLFQSDPSENQVWATSQFEGLLDCWLVLATARDTVDSQKIDFYIFLSLRTWSASYTLKEAALIIANLSFSPEAKRKEKTQKLN